MTPFDESSEPLSSEGRARRDRIRLELEGVARRRRTVRLARRGLAAAAVLLLGVRLLPISPPALVPVPPVRPVLEFTEIVRTDPGILSRYAIPARTPEAEILLTACRMEDYLIGDEALVELLAEAGQPQGLIRVDGKVYLAGEFCAP